MSFPPTSAVEQQRAKQPESSDAFSLLAFRVLLCYVVIAYAQPQNRFVFLWPLHIADLTFILAAGLHVIACLRARTPLVRFGPATVLAFALLFFAMLSQYIGLYQISSAWNPFIDYIVKNALLLILLEAMLTTPKRVWATQMVIVVATFWWLKSGLSLVHSGASYGSGGRFAGGTVSLIENPNGFAYMLCLYIPLYLYVFQCAKRKWERIAGIALAAAAMFLVFKTGSRTGLVTLIPMGILLLPQYAKSHRTGLVVSIAAIVILFPLTGEQNMARFRTIPAQIRQFLGIDSNEADHPLNQDEQSADERKWKNEDTWRLIKKYPVFGVGIWPDSKAYRREFPGTFGQVHCETLMAGRQMGFIGIFLHFGFILTIWFGGWMVRKRARDWPAASDLGRVFQLQAWVIVIGGSFCPLPWGIPTLTAAACASALAGFFPADDSELPSSAPLEKTA